MRFEDLDLIEPILKALDKTGYTNPTPIQEKAIPILLKGTDLLGCAQTGTGKTAAFAIPIIQLIHNSREKAPERRQIKALVVTPTRELAIQIEDSFYKYAKFTSVKNTVIFGGVKQGKQVDKLKRGVDVLVATPGRLLDLIGQGFISLNHIDYFVLDEADQMLDMGFIHDIKKLIAMLPKKRQSLFFSATMPPAIVSLSNNILGPHEKITIKPEQKTADKVEQALYFVAKKDKIKLLAHLLKSEDIQSALVFSRTKHGANKIVKLLGRSDIRAEAIHGNKSQTARQKALGNFKDGRINVLVATDIAARGIDVSGLSHVVNYDLPNIPETYVHRIGRTGRADASGMALSFCMGEERPYLKDIQKLIKQTIPVITDHPYEDDGTAEPSTEEKRPQRNQRRSNDRSQRSNRSQRDNRGGRNKSQNRDHKNSDRRDSNDGSSSREDRRTGDRQSNDRRNEGRSDQRRSGSNNDNDRRDNRNDRNDKKSDRRDDRSDRKDDRNTDNTNKSSQDQKQKQRRDWKKRKPTQKPKNLKWPLE